jgi:hypothetical protein
VYWRRADTIPTVIPRTIATTVAVVTSVSVDVIAFPSIALTAWFWMLTPRSPRNRPPSHRK